MTQLNANQRAQLALARQRQLGAIRSFNQVMQADETQAPTTVKGFGDNGPIIQRLGHDPVEAGDVTTNGAIASGQVVAVSRDGAVRWLPSSRIDKRIENKPVKSPNLVLLSQYLGTSSNRARKWTEPKYPGSEDTMFLGQILDLSIHNNKWVCCGSRSHLNTETEKFIPIAVSIKNRKYKASQQQLYIPPEFDSSLTLHSIAHGSEGIVAVGSQSSIFYSENGKDWIVLEGFFVEGNQNIEGSQTFQDIAFNNSIFLLPGGLIDDDEEATIALDPKFRGIAKSSDGVNWESSLMRIPGDSWIRAAWGNGRWVVMGRRAIPIPGDPFSPTLPPPGPFNPYPDTHYRIRFHTSNNQNYYTVHHGEKHLGGYNYECTTVEDPRESSNQSVTRWTEIEPGDYFRYIPNVTKKNVSGGVETWARAELELRDSQGRLKKISSTFRIRVYSYQFWQANGWGTIGKFSGCFLGSRKIINNVTNITPEYDFFGAPPPPPPPGPPPFPPVRADSTYQYTTISVTSEDTETWSEIVDVGEQIAPDNPRGGSYSLSQNFVFGEVKFFAFAASHSDIAAENGIPAIIYSSDGQTWLPAEEPFPDEDNRHISGLTYSKKNKLYFAISGGGKVAYSNTGIDGWSEPFVPKGLDNFEGVNKLLAIK